MDYNELYERVKAALPAGACFCVGVETWCNHPGDASPPSWPSWQIYLEEPGCFYRGATAQAAFDAFVLAISPPPQNEPATQAAASEEAPAG
jgi:hypothetical protein